MLIPLIPGSLVCGNDLHILIHCSHIALHHAIQLDAEGWWVYPDSETL